MARDAAVITTWGRPVIGREAKSLEVFMDFLTFWAKQAADGKCSEPEPFFATDASSGLAIVRGKSDALNEILDSEEYERLVTKGQFIVEDLKVHMYLAGDEEVQRGTRIFAEAGNELGYM
jgi:hypothetical protein